MLSLIVEEEKTERKTNQNNLIENLFNLGFFIVKQFCLPSSIIANSQFVTHYWGLLVLQFRVRINFGSSRIISSSL